jgi:hypothetical protein
MLLRQVSATYEEVLWRTGVTFRMSLDIDVWACSEVDGKGER